MSLYRALQFISILATVSAAPAFAEPSDVVVESVHGRVIVYMSEHERYGDKLVPRVGDVLTPPLTILTSNNSRIDIRILGYELSIAPSSSVVIPAGSDWILQTI